MTDRHDACATAVQGMREACQPWVPWHGTFRRGVREMSAGVVAHRQPHDPVADRRGDLPGGQPGETAQEMPEARRSAPQDTAPEQAAEDAEAHRSAIFHPPVGPAQGAVLVDDSPRNSAILE